MSYSPVQIARAEALIKYKWGLIEILGVNEGIDITGAQMDKLKRNHFISLI